MKRTLSSLMAVAYASFCFAIDYPDVIIFNKSPLPDSRMLYDQSDIKTVGSSTCTYEEFYGGKKIPVSTTLKNGGADDNSLKITWNSVSGGDWIAGVAKSDWSNHDMNKYASVDFYLYSESAISYNDLPNVMLTEDGFRSSSNKVSLANYVGGSELPAGQWRKISIPMNMFQPYAAWNKTQRIAFCQRNADGVQHTMYVDDLTLVGVKGYEPPVVDQITLFNDSPASDRYDLSFAGQWGDGTSFWGVDGKVKVASTPVYSGSNSLHLHWLTAAGGGCFAKIETQKSEDFSFNQLIQLSMYIYAPMGVTKEQLPKIKFESSSEGATSEQPLGNYVVGPYVNDQWIQVQVPLSSLKELNWAGYSQVAGLTFVMVEPNSVEKEIYVDEIKVDKGGATGVVSSQQLGSLFYHDGMFRFNHNVGKVYVTNLSGMLLFDGIVNGSSLELNLSTGVYFVRVGQETSKIVVQ